MSLFHILGTNFCSSYMSISIFLFLLFNLYFTICSAGHLVNFSNLIAE